MSFDASRFLRHMSWANQKVFSAVQELPDEAFTSYLTNQEFDAARIMQHIVEGANWYTYCLCQHADRPRLRPTTSDDVATLADELLELDAIILREASGDDEMMTFSDEYGTHTALRSTIVFQAIHHATEHRAQLIDAFECRGFQPINLDDIDLWAFEVSERS